MRFDPETTIDEFKTMNKIKMVKNLILYLQDVPRFGKFFNYGCHCFRNEGRDYLKGVIQKEISIHKLKINLLIKLIFFCFIFFLLLIWIFFTEVSIGKPQDRPDKVCRDHSRCHACIKPWFTRVFFDSTPTLSGGIREFLWITTFCLLQKY